MRVTISCRYWIAFEVMLLFSSFYPRHVLTGVFATATWLGGWLAGWVYAVLYQND